MAEKSVHGRHGLAAAGLCLFLAAWPLAASEILSATQWRADLDQLARSIKDIHFKPFHNTTEKAFDAEVAALARTLPEKSDAEIVVAMAEIVASLRDGHTRLHLPRRYPEFALEAELGHSGTAPPRIDALRLQQLPVRFGLFEDGLFVTGATQNLRHLIGQEVLAFGTTPVAVAIEQVRRVSFFENDSRARLMAPDRLALPEVLAALRIVDAPASVVLHTRTADGGARSGLLANMDDDFASFVDGAPVPAPLWLRHRDRHHWYETLGDQGAIFVQINQFAEKPERPYSDFVADAIGAARAAGVNRFVIDLRHNSGGTGAWTIPFLTGLIRSEFNEYGRLFVLMGRTTFSAAQHFLHEFEAYTYANFVGEPSGARPSHYGDGKRVILEQSGLTLRVSTVYWHSWLANDFRDAIQPHVDAGLRSADFFAGRDPGLAAALSYQAPAGIARQIEEQFRKGKNQNGLLLLQRYITDGSFGNHAQAVPALRALGHRLLDDALSRPGFFIFFLTDTWFPGDPQTLAGLGRASEIEGETEEALQAYRQALAIDPGNALASEGLARIGTTPKARE